MTVPARTSTPDAGQTGTPHGNRSAHHQQLPSDRRAAPWAGPEAAPGRPASTVLDPRLAAILRCPLTGGKLIPVDADRLMSDRPFRDGVHPVFPISNGIPGLSPDR